MQELVEAMLDRHHVSAEGAGGGGDGAALVFLPGAREIGSLQARLPSLLHRGLLTRYLLTYFTAAVLRVTRGAPVGGVSTKCAARQARLGSGGADRLHVVPLHSQLTTAEQQLAFAPPPKGCTKVRRRRSDCQVFGPRSRRRT